MIDDFRSKLYSKYVSRFKKEQYAADKTRLKRVYREYAYRSRKVLRDLSSEVSILELGCGPGFLLSCLRDQGFSNLRGIDVSDEQVSIAREQGLDVVHADVFDYLPEQCLQYDVVIAFDFIEHFHKEELFDLFPLINGALRKDGRLIIQTPNGQGLFPGENIYGDLTHFTIFSELSLRQTLWIHGFGDISFYETGPAPISVSGSIRCILWKVVKVFLRCIRRIETNKTTRLWTENLICICRKKTE